MRVFEKKKIRSKSYPWNPICIIPLPIRSLSFTFPLRERQSFTKRGNRWCATNEKFSKKKERKRERGWENVRTWRKDNILGWAITLAVGVSISSSSSRKGVGGGRTPLTTAPKFVVIVPRIGFAGRLRGEGGRLRGKSGVHTEGEGGRRERPAILVSTTKYVVRIAVTGPAGKGGLATLLEICPDSRRSQVCFSPLN